MSICVIMNPRAGSAHQREDLEELFSKDPSVTLRETAAPGHARELAAEAVRAGSEVVAAAGGDGTIHEVVNGIMDAGGGATLGIIPMGTGNDLVRTLAIPNDPAEAFAVLTTGERRALDLMRVDSEGTHRYVINAAAGGFSGQVDEAITEDMKRRWGPLAFVMGAVSVLPDLTGYETLLSYDDGPPEPVDVINVIVANARTVGGGVRVAPLANPQDGLFDVVLVERAPVVQLGGVAARLLAGTYLDSELVQHRRARTVEIISRPGMWFNVDGELLSKEPIRFTIVPAALRVIVGADYTAEPAEQ